MQVEDDVDAVVPEVVHDPAQLGQVLHVVVTLPRLHTRPHGAQPHLVSTS